MKTDAENFSETLVPCLPSAHRRVPEAHNIGMKFPSHAELTLLGPYAEFCYKSIFRRGVALKMETVFSSELLVATNENAVCYRASWLSVIGEKSVKINYVL
jgi:hypothetical protein